MESRLLACLESTTDAAQSLRKLEGLYFTLLMALFVVGLGLSIAKVGPSVPPGIETISILGVSLALILVRGLARPPIARRRRVR
jgi:hypothetical protein